MSHESQASLIAIANEYGNCMDDFAHKCLFTPVSSCTKSFQWREFDKEAAYKQHNDLISCYAQVHEIQDVPSKLINDSTEDFALEVPVCRDEIEMQKCQCSAQAELDLKQRAVKRAVQALMLNKEKRAMDLVLDPNLYPASNVTALAGSEFNVAGGADPLAVLHQIITDAKYRPFNYAMMSKKVLARLQKHPSFLGNVDARGAVSKEAIAATLGLDGICLSGAKIDLAPYGLAQDLADMMDDSILLFYRNDRFDSTDCGQHTFAFEAWYQSIPGNEMGFEVYTRGGSSYQDNWDMGLRGGYRAKVGYGSKMVVADYELGHLITNAVDLTQP